MLVRLERTLKRIIIGVICVTSVLSAVISSIPNAQAATSILGTNASLGSPILNEKATSDNWNKWEMVCWGVFLSNWCQPLIDTYNSAFTTSSGRSTGSNGSGYKALCFGSGSDTQNNKTIQDFCTYAIKVEEETALKNIYVAYTDVTDGTLGEKPDPNTDASVAREAKFNDLLFESSLTTDADGNKVTSATISTKSQTNYGDITMYVKEAYVPTFYVKNSSNKFVTLLDFTNSWDLQAFTAMVNAIRKTDSGSNYASQFDKALDDYKTSNPVLGMDVFGNIVIGTDKVMVFPACNNQNITTEKSINVLNSWIMNNYVSTYSSDKLVSELHQTDAGNDWLSKMSAFFGGYNFDTDNEYCGLPAFGADTVANVGYLYYDTDAIVEKEGSYSINSVMTALFDADIESENNKYPIEFEIAGVGYKTTGSGGTDTGSGMYKSLTYVSSLLTNTVNKSATGTQPEILHEIVNTDGSKISIFSEKAIVVPVQVVTKSEDKNSKNGDALRHYYNWLYQVYSGNVSSNSPGSSATLTASQLNGYLKQMNTVSDLKSTTDSTLWNYFTNTYTDYKGNSVTGSALWDAGNNETLDKDTARLCKVYPTSSIMKSVSSVLCVADGTEFNTYSTMLYMTYLDWYGVINKSTMSNGTEAQSNFNPDIYDITSDVLNVDITDITDLMSEEDLENEVLQMSYLMLSTENGRSYRKELMYNGIADFLYEQYNRIVYGGSSSVYSGSATKSNSGFLAVSTFSENFLTSWFLEQYVDIAVILIMVCMIILIILGILKNRKFSWFIVGAFTIVNVILIVPASGEITPAITTNFTQKIFSSKMTYWALSEGIANASIESDAYNTSGDLDGLSSEEATTVLKLVNQLSVVYTDRSLMLKQDISQKLTQNLGGVYTNIQSIQSARWILPMVMQQFSADEVDKEDYIYVKLSNVWDDGSNLYWYYRPSDATSVTKPTATSQQFVSGDAAVGNSDGTGCAEESTGNGGKNTYDGISQYYVDYKEPDWKDDTTTNINYANYSYTINDENKNNVHLYSYILHDQQLNFGSSSLKRENIFGSDYSSYESADSWESWINNAVSTLNKDSWATDKVGYYSYESISDTYDRSDASTLKDGYSYYKSTESPYYYFFNVVKDSFPNDKTVGALIGRLQGEIEETADEREVRSNFMYATSTSKKEYENSAGTGIGNSDVEYTGYVRDVLDLQEFFTNTVPYMYEMTIAAGGFDGQSGVLGDALITEESDRYKGNAQSWVYRCNWAVKLMENENFTTSKTARLADGTRITIKNPMLPECYEAAGRPMVFSEAQMYALGLSESDLTLVELKCIEVNKQTAKDWTLLINYAGTDGVTKEVLFRLMATSATEEFCREFSSSGILDNNYAIYPQSIDLRYLSFDAVMKMLMINVSHNTSYAYGDTMGTLLNDSDLFTAFLLLICSVLCVWVIPLGQELIMASIFYLGFIAILRSLFSSAAYKGRVAGAQVVSNVMFMVYTIAYYGMIGMLMSLSSSDEVLSVNKITTNPGNPVWMLLAVIVISCVYVFIMYQHLRFCFAHYRDMGAEMIGFVTGTVVGKMQDAVANVRESISNVINKNESTSSTSSTNISGTGISNETSQNVNITQSNDSTIKINKDSESSDFDSVDDIMSETYTTGETVNVDSTTTSHDIDAEIETGEKLSSDS